MSRENPINISSDDEFDWDQETDDYIDSDNESWSDDDNIAFQDWDPEIDVDPEEIEWDEIEIQEFLRQHHPGVRDPRNLPPAA